MKFEKPSEAEVILDTSLVCRDDNDNLLCKYVVTQNTLSEGFTVELFALSGLSTPIFFTTETRNRKAIEAEIENRLKGRSLQ
jgi:hypothetical protein